MFSFILKLVFVAATFVHHAATDRDTLPKPRSRGLSSPFVDLRPEDISIYNKLPDDQSLASEQSYPQHRRDVRDMAEELDTQIRLSILQSYVNFVIYISSLSMRVVKEKEKLINDYIECACTNHEKCKRVPELTEKDLNALSPLLSEPINVSKMMMVVSTLEKFLHRENAYYEYVTCACKNTSVCAKDMKPFLWAVFSNEDAIISDKVLNKLVYTKGASFKIPPDIINVINKMPRHKEFIDTIIYILEQLAPRYVAILTDSSPVTGSSGTHKGGSDASVYVSLEQKDEKETDKVQPSTL